MESSSRSFTRACGGAGSLTLLVVGPGDNQRVRYLTEQTFVIAGRHERAKVRLEGEQVGLRHAYFQVLGGRVFFIDLGSKLGVHAGNVRVMNGWLNPGQFIRIGPYHLSCNFKLESSDSDPYSALKDPLSDGIENLHTAPSLTADILVRNVVQSRWRMNRCLIMIGSSPLARLRLRDPSVSRLHCILVGTPDGIWVVDLLSRGGMFLNGVATSCACIRDGDCLQIGCFDLRFHLTDAAPRQILLAKPAPVNALTKIDLSGSMLMQSVPSEATPLAESSALVPILQQLGSMQHQMMDQFQQMMMMMMQSFGKMHQEQMGLMREEMAHLVRLNQELHDTRQQLSKVPAPTVPEPRSIPVEAGAKAPPARGAAPAPPPTPREPLQPTPKQDSPNVHGWLSERIANLEQERQTVWQRMMGSVLGR